MKKAVAIIVSCIMLFCLFSYGMWSMSRAINYRLSYKSMVEKTVTDMVKKECLKE